MVKRRAVHPLLALKKKQRMSWAALARLCDDRGYEVTAHGLRLIGIEERGCGRELAAFLADNILDDGTTAEQLVMLYGPQSVADAA
jgi:hypothetical protein